MKKKEKQGLLILIIVAIVIIAIIWFATRPKDKQPEVSGTNPAQGEFTKVEADGTITNTSEKLKEDKTMEGFKVTDITFKEQNGETILTASITNQTNSAQEGFFGKIVLLDKEGNEIGRIPIMVSETQNGETIDVEATITESYANAYNFRLEK